MLSFGLDALYCALRSISLTVKRGPEGLMASGVSYLSLTATVLCPCFPGDRLVILPLVRPLRSGHSKVPYPQCHTGMPPAGLRLQLLALSFIRGEAMS